MTVITIYRLSCLSTCISIISWCGTYRFQYFRKCAFAFLASSPYIRKLLSCLYSSIIVVNLLYFFEIAERRFSGIAERRHFLNFRRKQKFAEIAERRRKPIFGKNCWIFPAGFLPKNPPWKLPKSRWYPVDFSRDGISSPCLFSVKFGCLPAALRFSFRFSLASLPKFDGLPGSIKTGFLRLPAVFAYTCQHGNKYAFFGLFSLVLYHFLYRYISGW